MNGVTIEDIVVQYERRLREAEAAMLHARVNHTLAATVLVLATASLFVLGISAIRKQAPTWWPSLPAPVAVASARLYRRYRDAGFVMWRIRRYCDGAIERMRGNWHGRGASGEGFDDAGHPYSRDLNLFGSGSLFELLCITRTGIGRRVLADYLLKPPSLEEVLARQAAVAELRARTDLREQIALLGSSEFSESRWETFIEWIDAPSGPCSPLLRIVIFVSSTTLATLILSGLLGLFSWHLVAAMGAPIILFHCVVGLVLRGRIVPMIESLRMLTLETQVLREGLRLLEKQRFNSIKLNRICAQARNSSRQIRILERLLRALGERNKDWFYLPYLLLMLGTQLCMSVERWRATNRPALRTWLMAWGEFEALNALTCYSYENPDNTFPTFSDESQCFEAEAIGHPLLQRQACVRNDVELNSTTRFYIVSGSNMAGKTTLLRTIGLNAVLAFAGAPVRAQGLRLSIFSVCASISVVDSLLEGKSRFLAEVDRLRLAIELASRAEPVLFLVDEIFGGTNSGDRRVAAEAVIRTLVSRGAFGAISTHDLALTEIVDGTGLGGVNVHMGSKDGSDPMDFDYCLKPGVTRETNALAIARMSGVPI